MVAKAYIVVNSKECEVSILIVLIGFFLWLSAARGFSASGGQQSDSQGLVTLLMQVGGIGLIIWGIIGFF